MTVDPAVRSVRVAVVLCERFAKIMKGPQTVRSHKQSGALVGFSGDQSEMSLRIGEAQQIYPEIWQHLDDARKTFAARGIDVAAYDAIRAAEGQGIGAAVEVVAQVHGVGRHQVEQQVKSANFNREGLARAKQAIDAFVKVTPDIDWAAIAKAEAEDPDVVAFGRSAKIKRWASLSLIVIVLASPFVYLIHKHLKASEHHDVEVLGGPVVAPPMSDDERAALLVKVHQLHDKLEAARPSWTPEALAALAPGPLACPLPFEAPSERDAARFIRDGNRDMLGKAAFAGYKATEPFGDELANMIAVDELVTEHLEANQFGRADRTRLDSITPPFVFLLIDHEVEPVITATAPAIAFTPGQVTGRAYVFSVEAGQMVCAAKIDVRNSDPSTVLDGVRRKADAAAVLHRELEIRIRQALATGLHAPQ